MPSKATGTGSARSWLGTWPGRGSADDPVVDSLLSITRKAWAQNLRLLIAYGDLAADLEADGVEMVALKGAALAVFPNATASFTVPVNPDGTISLEVANETSVVMSLTGYWKTPTATDTGLGLHPLDAPERLVDTTTGTGTCDDSVCGRLTALSDTTVAAAGHAGIPADASAIMVAVNVIDPAGPGLVGIGAETGQSSGAFVFDTGDNTQASFITPLSEAGTLNANSWAATDLTIDVIGYFTAPTRTYRYTYDTTGLRASKSLDDEGVTGQGWSKEFTWDTSGGLPLLLAEHRGSQTSYVVYGPQGTPIYQVTATGDVMYFHQDHLGSIRLVTNANGTTKGTLTYNAYGKPKTNTTGWLQEQPLLGYNSQYHTDTSAAIQGTV